MLVVSYNEIQIKFRVKLIQSLNSFLIGDLMLAVWHWYLYNVTWYGFVKGTVLIHAIERKVNAQDWEYGYDYFHFVDLLYFTYKDMIKVKLIISSILFIILLTFYVYFYFKKTNKSITSLGLTALGFIIVSLFFGEALVLGIIVSPLLLAYYLNGGFKTRVKGLYIVTLVLLVFGYMGTYVWLWDSYKELLSITIADPQGKVQDINPDFDSYEFVA